MDGWMDGRMDGWLGGWLGGWVDAWVGHLPFLVTEVFACVVYLEDPN